MKKNYLLLSLFICASILVTNCTKGPIGLTGAQGETGANGTNGTDGTDGTNGTNGTDGADGADGTDGADGAQGPAGTANVIYSDWFPNDDMDVPWADSIVSSTVSGIPETISRTIKYVPDITAGILDSGVVFSYIKSSVLISPQLLPWTFALDDQGSMLCQMNLVPQLGGILYYISNLSTLNASYLSPDGTFYYRYIIIPGGVLAGGRKIDPKSMSYSELCRTYHIPL